MVCITSETEGEVGPVKKCLSPPVTDPPIRLFCCGSLLPVFSVRVLATFHIRCVYIIFSLVWVSE